MSESKVTGWTSPPVVLQIPASGACLAVAKCLFSFDWKSNPPSHTLHYQTLFVRSQTPLGCEKGLGTRLHQRFRPRRETKSGLTSCNRHHKVQILWSRGTDLLYPYCCSWSDTEPAVRRTWIISVVRFWYGVRIPKVSRLILNWYEHVLNNLIHICSNYSTDTRQQTHLYRIMQEPEPYHKWMFFCCVVHRWAYSGQCSWVVNFWKALHSLEPHKFWQYTVIRTLTCICTVVIICKNECRWPNFIPYICN